MLRKNLIVLMVTLALIFMVKAPVVLGQCNSLELETEFNGSTATPQLNLYAEKMLTLQFGLFGFSVSSEAWSQAYAGPIYKPNAWLAVSVGYGIEADDNPGRLGSCVLVITNRFSLCGVYEYGGSGNWYKGIAICQVTKALGLGAMDQKFLDLGPRVELTVWKMKVWSAAFWPEPDNKLISHVGLSFNF